MLSPRGIHHADQLRAMLDDGALPDDGPVELAYGVLDSPDLAARIVLAEIDHLAQLVAAGLDIPDRWSMAEADLEAVWWLVITRVAGPAH